MLLPNYIKCLVYCIFYLANFGCQIIFQNIFYSIREFLCIDFGNFIFHRSYEKYLVIIFFLTNHDSASNSNEYWLKTKNCEFQCIAVDRHFRLTNMTSCYATRLLFTNTLKGFTANGSASC